MSPDWLERKIADNSEQLLRAPVRGMGTPTPNHKTRRKALTGHERAVQEKCQELEVLSGDEYRYRVVTYMLAEEERTITGDALRVRRMLRRTRRAVETLIDSYTRSIDPESLHRRRKQVFADQRAKRVQLIHDLRVFHDELDELIAATAHTPPGRAGHDS